MKVDVEILDLPALVIIMLQQFEICPRSHQVKKVIKPVEASQNLMLPVANNQRFMQLKATANHISESVYTGHYTGNRLYFFYIFCFISYPS